MILPENLDDHVRLNELNQALEEARKTQEAKLSEWGRSRHRTGRI